MKTREDILEILRQVMEDLFEIEPDQVTFDADLYGDLEINSIDAVDLVVELRKLTGKQIDPDDYYPEGYTPELLEEWPADSDIVVPIEALPDNLRKSMGGHWELTQKNRKALEERNE